VHRSCGWLDAIKGYPFLNLLNHNRIDFVRDVVEAVGDFFKVIVDFGADDEVHGVGIAVLEE
jgi:hypothetical protein